MKTDQTEEPGNQRCFIMNSKCLAASLCIKIIGLEQNLSKKERKKETDKANNISKQLN